MLPEKHKVFSVSRLNRTVKETLAGSFGRLWVEGEISNLSMPSSGHIYFSLKDEHAQVRCAMFRSKNRKLDFKLENGMKTMVHATLDLYTVRGEFQLIVETLELAGTGHLQQKFEILKKKLQAEGLFDQERKRPIPAFPQAVGVITSPGGAAVQDVCRVLKERFIPAGAIVYPCSVQGKDAPISICRALSVANARREADVLIIARGGGSFEDLDAFNQEPVVRTVAGSLIPTISGIGHEIDFTLIDFAADCRAPTPTAAAIKACPDKLKLNRELKDLQQKLSKQHQYRSEAYRGNLKMLKARLAAHHPEFKIKSLMQHFDEISERLSLALRNIQGRRQIKLVTLLRELELHTPLKTIREQSMQIIGLRAQLLTVMQARITQRIHLAAQHKARLHNLNPLAVLKRGFSLTTNQNGKIIRSASQVHHDEKIKIRVEKGAISAVVKKRREL